MDVQTVSPLWPSKELSRRGVEVKLNHKPSPEKLKAEGYNAVIACIGSRAKRPDLGGADQPGIWTSKDVYEGRAEIGQKVVVVDGGEVATKTVVYLAKQGNVSVFGKARLL